MEGSACSNGGGTGREKSKGVPEGTRSSGPSGLPFLWCQRVEKLQHKRQSQKSLQDSCFPRGMSKEDVTDNK